MNLGYSYMRLAAHGMSTGVWNNYITTATVNWVVLVYIYIHTHNTHIPITILTTNRKKKFLLTELKISDQNL